MKKNIVAISFFVILGIMFFGNIITPDKKESEILKKDLTQFPEISLETIFSGEFSEELNDYAKDQQFLSERMSQLVAGANYGIFNKTLNKNIYLKEDSLYELMYPEKTSGIEAFESNINRFKYMFRENESNVVIIPDKSMYLAGNDLKLSNDVYNDFSFDVIDMYDTLSAEDYYKTDLHLTNEGAYKVYEYLIDMLLSEEAIDVEFETVSDDFQGYYTSTSMYLGLYDEIKKPTNDIIDNLIVKHLENGQFTTHNSVYFEKYLDTLDQYSYMLGGNKAVTVIENDNPSKAGEGKELVLIKDSYSLAIAPYLAQHYSKVTLLDFRILNVNFASEYISTDAEILYIYGFKTFNDGTIATS